MQVFTEDHPITITQDGAVGIHNDTPDSSYALDVGGSIRIAGDLAVEGLRPLPRGYLDCDLTHMWDDIEPAVNYLECTVGPTTVLVAEETLPSGATGIAGDSWALLTVSDEGALKWSAADPTWDSGYREWRDGVDPELRVIAGAYKDAEGKWLDKFIWLNRKEVYPIRETFGRYAVYTSNGTWVRPPYAATVVVVALGGGGGGGAIADFFHGANPGGRGGDSEFVEPGGVILVAGTGGEGGMYGDGDDDSPGGSGGGGQGIYVYPGEQGGTSSMLGGYGGAAGLPGPDALDLLQVVLNQSGVSPGSRKSPPISGEGLAGNYYGGGGTGATERPPLAGSYGSGGGGGMGASVLDLIEFGAYTINVGDGGAKGDGWQYDGGAGRSGFIIICW